MEKMQLNNFPIVSLWELSVAMGTYQEVDWQKFSQFRIALIKATFLPNKGHTASMVLEELS